MSVLVGLFLACALLALGWLVGRGGRAGAGGPRVPAGTTARTGGAQVMDVLTVAVDLVGWSSSGADYFEVES